MGACLFLLKKKGGGSEIVLPRIRILLEKGAKRPLTMVIGPAGCGKTTLVAWFARMLSNRPTWRVLWYQASSDGEIKAKTLLNEMQPHANEQVMVVIDDCHLLPMETVAHLTEELPSVPNAHLILISRVKLGIRMYQLRLEDKIVEINSNDLRFSADDVSRFFRERQVAVSDAQLNAITEATNGWVAGLQMISLQTRESVDPQKVLNDPASGTPWVADFLKEEIMPELSPEETAFVCRTCMLDCFDSDLVDKITGERRSRMILEHLRDINLIVDMPSKGGMNEKWLRYHPLFIESLRQSMFSEISVDELTRIKEAAVGWYEEQGRFKLAIRAALSYGLHDKAFELVTNHLYPVLTSIDSATLPQWMDKLPRPGEKDEYLYCLVNAWAYFISGRLKRSDIWLKRVEELSDRANRSDYRGTNSIYRAIKVGTMVFSGEYKQALELGSMALDNLGGPQLFLRCTIMHNMGEALQRLGRYQEAYEFFSRAKVNAEISGRRVVELLCLCEIAWLQYVRGRLDTASNTLMRILAHCDDDEKRNAWPIGLAHASLARIYLRWGDDTKAALHIDSALTILNSSENRDAFVEVQVVQAEALMVTGNYEDAHDVLLAVYEIVQCDRLPRGINLLALITLAENLCLMGNNENALKVIKEARTLMNQEDVYYWSFSCLVESHVHLSLGEHEAAEHSLDEADSLLSESDLDTMIRPLKVSRACLLRSRGFRAEARKLMVEALTSATLEEHLHPFVYPVPHSNAVLYDIAHSTGDNKIQENECKDARALALRVLEMRGMAHDAETPSSQDSSFVQEESFAQLSEREKQIYELLKQGKTRRQISEKLGIQLNTTRTHIRNIYQKTGVHDRSLL